jgi:hypothetical protein
MTPLRRRKNSARRSVDGLWAVVACATLGACLVLGIVTQIAIGSPWRGVAEPGENALHDEETALRASILFIPRRGNDCQYNQFDNKTGQIWHSGYVPCDIALSGSGADKSKGWSMARTEAIRGGFRWKP